MVPRGLEHQVKFPEVLERLVAPHFLLCEDSSGVCRPECHEEVCRHVRAEFSHFSNRALVPRHASEYVCYIRIDNVGRGTEALLGHNSGIEGCSFVTLRQRFQEVLDRQLRMLIVVTQGGATGAKDAAAASKTKKGKKGAK